jgi:two-component system, sensor histidine kinase
VSAIIPATAPARTGTPAAAKRPADHWLAGIGAVLLLAMAAVVWLQYRQMAMLDSQVRYEGDNLVWSFFQLESEYLQLRDELREAVIHPAEDRSETLRTRFELFASRLPLVDPSRTQSVVDLGPAHGRTVAAIQRFIERHDPVLAENATTPITSARLQQVLDDMRGLQAPIHDLAMLSNHIVAELIGRRNDVVRDQSRLEIALTAVQLLLIALFASVAARQFRSLKTRRNELEALAEHLQEARAEAVRASQAKTVFLANMSHELRTPFNGLLGMLSLLEGTRLDDTQTRHLSTARESATHLLDVLNDILDFSKLESGQLAVAPEPVDVSQLVREVAAVIGPSARSKGLDFQLDLAPELPDWVLVDGRRLKQILFNLCTNAVKFTERGHIGLAVRPDATSATTGRWRFVVRDTGIGMDQAMRARLFQRFTQGDAGTSRRYGGTGLGLEISRSLARAMGGEIEVDSSPGEGSTFVLTLGLSSCAAPPPEPAPQLVDRSTLTGLDLLVADDHPVNRSYMALLLERMGHQVRLADNGVQAVAAVRQQVPDLVFMDLHMPEQDGFEAAQVLRALPPPACRVPIVALTADVFNETRQRVAQAGMDDFLAKPVRPDDIIAVLAKTLGHLRRPSPAAATSNGPDGVATPAPLPAPARTTESRSMPSLPPSPPAPVEAHRRRFRSSDVSTHLDMAVIGDICVGVSLGGWRQVLRGLLDDESGRLAALLAALEQAETGELPAQAHALKGAAASVGLRAVSAEAARIESQGAGFDAADCAAAAAVLRSHLADARGLLERMGLL